MKTTKFQKLENLLLSPFSVSGIRNNSREQSMLRCILTSGRARTGYYQSSGRHAKAIDLTGIISNILTKLDIAHETGNEAPRGGVWGNYIKVTSPAFMADVKTRKRTEEAKRAMLLAEEAKKAEALKAEREAREAEIEAEAAKIDLEPYREKIMEIIDRKPSIWGTVGRDTLSTKEIGKVVWYMINHYKGFNPHALKRTLQSFNVE